MCSWLWACAAGCALRSNSPPPSGHPSLQAPPQIGDSEGAVELVRSALLAARPRRSLSTAALDLLAQPELKQASARKAGGPHRVLQWIKERTGVGPSQLALATQMVVAYTLGGWAALVG